jgi:periodic tryptophan protein 2
MSEMERVIHKGRFILSLTKNFKEGKIKSAEYHSLQRLLLIGQRNGTIHIHRFEQAEVLESEKPPEGDFLTLLQTFQIAEAPIDAISFNEDGNWIALGLRLTGQLIVWEWRSQSYILNQSQLSYEVTSMCMSSSLIATGAVGGVIRLWDSQSMLCVARFTADNASTDM